MSKRTQEFFDGLTWDDTKASFSDCKEECEELVSMGSNDYLLSTWFKGVDATGNFIIPFSFYADSKKLTISEERDNGWRFAKLVGGCSGGVDTELYSIIKTGINSGWTKGVVITNMGVYYWVNDPFCIERLAGPGEIYHLPEDYFSSDVGSSVSLQPEEGEGVGRSSHTDMFDNDDDDDDDAYDYDDDKSLLNSNKDSFYNVGSDWLRISVGAKWKISESSRPKCTNVGLSKWEGDFKWMKWKS